MGGIYVSAQVPNTSLRFRGVLDTTYTDPYAKIVQSMWHANLLPNGNARFTATYTELHIGGERAGTYDSYRMSMEGTWTNLDPKVYVIEGTLYIEQIDGDTLAYDATDININPTDWGNQLGIEADGGPTDPWSMYGTFLPQ